MPNIATVHSLLASRLPRSLDAWRERLELQVRDTHRPCVILARLTRSDQDPWTTEDLLAARRLLGFNLLRHLGASEYLVELIEHADQNTLALDGHLDKSRDGYRLTAI